MLPHDEWLDRAKRLAIGMRIRVNHRRERRPNMVIGNDADKWWAYCQSCKEGGVMQKEHVLLGVKPPPPVVLTLPTDIKPVLGSEYEQVVGQFLAKKHIMYPYLPTVHYSEQAKRIMIKDETLRWHGRDITDRSPAKWLHYGASFSGYVDDCIVLVEDMFSMWKVRFALCGAPKHASVMCTLGTSPSQSAVFALRNAKHIVWAYDGDKAGDDGYDKGRLRMQAFVPKQTRVRPPEGLDPKDMSCEEIRLMMREAV